MFDSCSHDIVNIIIEYAAQQDVNKAYKLLLINKTCYYILCKRFQECKLFWNRLYCCVNLESEDEFIRQLIIGNIIINQKVKTLFDIKFVTKTTVANTIYHLQNTSFYSTYYHKICDAKCNNDNKIIKIMDKRIPLYRSIQNADMLHYYTFVFLRILFFEIYNSITTSFEFNNDRVNSFWKNYQLIQMGIISYETVNDYFTFQKYFGLCVENYNFDNLVNWETDIIQGLHHMTELKYIQHKCNADNLSKMFLRYYKKLKTIVMAKQYYPIDNLRSIYNNCIYYYSASLAKYTNEYEEQIDLHEDMIIKYVLINLG